MSSPERLLRYVDALREAAAQEMARDPSAFVFGLDVDDHLGIQSSTKGLVDQFRPERVFTTPLSEDAMTGVAIGAGMRPVHVHIRMDFLMLCMNQLVNIAAKAHYMWGGQTKVPLVVREGADVTVVGISNMVLECLRAAELLSQMGIEAEVVDPITLAPLDIDTILASALKTRRLLVVDNGWTMAGASAEINALSDVEIPADSGEFKLMSRRVVDHLRHAGL